MGLSLRRRGGRRLDGWSAATIACALLVVGPLIGLPLSFVTGANGLSRFSGFLPEALVSTARKVDVRVIAATNRDLEREVNRGRFREDLYFRLSVIRVRLPPLRERLEDIPCLVQAFLERMDAASAEPLFTPEVYRELKAHDWPGNVRELRNYVERALVLDSVDTGSVPSTRDGQRASRSGEEGSPLSASDVEQPFKVAKERVIVEFEKAYLERLMQWAQGNVSRAARKAKIDRMYLHRLLQRYAMSRDSQPDR